MACFSELVVLSDRRISLELRTRSPSAAAWTSLGFKWHFSNLPISSVQVAAKAILRKVPRSRQSMMCKPYIDSSCYLRWLLDLTSRNKHVWCFAGLSSGKSHSWWTTGQGFWIAIGHQLVVSFLNWKSTHLSFIQVLYVKYLFLCDEKNAYQVKLALNGSLHDQWTRLCLVFCLFRLWCSSLLQHVLS